MNRCLRGLCSKVAEQLKHNGACVLLNQRPDSDVMKFNVMLAGVCIDYSYCLCSL